MHFEHDGTLHEHEHTHEDGITHSHAHHHHTDLNDHEHHTHSPCSQSIHCDENLNCAECGHEHISPREELVALMKYMVGHNASHANELANLAKQLETLGETAAYEQIMLAVSDFEKGNLRLSTVLAAMKE